MKLSERSRSIKSSSTMALAAEAAALRAQGVDVISCGVGEPDFDTPEHIKKAAAAAMYRGKTKYTPVPGTPELRAAIADKLERENDLGGYRWAEEVCVSCGGKQALFNAFLALLDPGDEVLLPGPYWVSYPEMVKLTGATAVVLPTDPAHGFKLGPEVLARHVGSRTRAVVLNSPSNPAGVVYTTAELEAFAEVLDRSDVVIISDDVYEHIRYVQRPRHIGAIAPGLRERMLVVNSLSKTYAMTGWRVGYAAGPRSLIGAMVKIQGQSTSNPNSIAQAAAVAALNGPQDQVAAMVAEFTRRRSLLLHRLRGIGGLECTPPDGSFYAFVDVSGLLGRSWDGGSLATSDDVARFLLADAHVAVVGGQGFGSATHLRISFALPAEQLAKGLDRIEAAIGRLR